MARNVSKTKHLFAQSTERRSDDVFRRITSLILDGKLGPGERLPAERDLSASLGVSRSVLREGLSHLEARGYIERRAKSGAYICTAMPRSIHDPLTEMVAQEILGVGEVIAVRKVLEYWAVREAAACGDPELLAALGKCVQDMEAAARNSILSLPRYEEADWTFHLTIARMTGNALYVHFFHFLRQLVTQSISLSRKIFPGDYLHENLQRHKDVYAAIAQHDAAAAEAAMVKHFELLDALLAQRDSAQQ